MVELRLPYVCGFLAFRECPAFVMLLDELRGSPLFPQVIMLDGNGVLHPRGFGAACHLGVLADVPTIGVGKTFLHVDGLTRDAVVAAAAAANRSAGDHMPITGASGRIWGAALRSTDAATVPLLHLVYTHACL